MWVKQKITFLRFSKYDVCAELNMIEIPYQCPLPAETFHFKDMKIEIPELPSAVKFVITVINLLAHVRVGD